MTDIRCNQAQWWMAKVIGAERGSRYSEWMRVKVLYFGVLRDRFGAADEVVELPDGAAVGELLRILGRRTSNDAMGDMSGLEERLWRSLAVAVNREYGSASILLRDGDEVALLPPVSGGYCAHGGTARTANGLASLASAGSNAAALALLANGRGGMF
jgi:molybdopterin converting factor subunit 1